MRYEIINKDAKVERTIIADESFMAEYLKDKDGYTCRLVVEPVFVPVPTVTIEDRLIAIETALAAIGIKVETIKTDIAIIKAK